MKGSAQPIFSQPQRRRFKPQTNQPHHVPHPLPTSFVCRSRVSHRHSAPTAPEPPPPALIPPPEPTACLFRLSHTEVNMKLKNGEKCRRVK
ncbi:hypothetical protein L6164_000941 [Bauhinia variegata]|uniref:Uncharacterized protein n=1 Tax=Bauhinia variegata TaxID=167791 RepID=A0ACB9Q804_BAUVA|nr:hypothetical protein L6164_000941 [Bauhinia variegata]